MSFCIDPHDSLGAEVVRVLREQIRTAAETATNRKEPLGRRVRSARLHCKKIRAALRLIRIQDRKTYRRENAWFRDSAGMLSELRDAEVLRGTFESLVSPGKTRVQPKRFEALSTLLPPPPTPVASGGMTRRLLADFSERMGTASVRLAKWKNGGADEAEIRAAFRADYRRARRAYERARSEQSAEAFHEWRKATKAHGYHVRLLGEAWPRITKAWRKELAALSALLGEEHDLTVLEQWFNQQGSAHAELENLRVFCALVDRRRGELRAAALLMGKRLFAERPSDVERRVGLWWSVAQMSPRKKR